MAVYAVSDQWPGGRWFKSPATTKNERRETATVASAGSWTWEHGHCIMHKAHHSDMATPIDVAGRFHGPSY